MTGEEKELSSVPIEGEKGASTTVDSVWEVKQMAEAVSMLAVSATCQSELQAEYHDAIKALLGKIKGIADNYCI